MAIRTWTEEQLREAVKTSVTYTQVIIKLGLKLAGGNYKNVKNQIIKFQLDSSHFLGVASTRGKKSYPIQDYFDGKRITTSGNLRKRLLRLKIFESKCYSCGLKEWMGKPIPLQLEHKDGNHNNNKLDNLTILCPNCHAQTPTFALIKRYINKDGLRECKSRHKY